MSGGGRPIVLFLVHRIPYPPNRGDRIRSFHMLDFLAHRAEVALAFLTDQSPSAETLQALQERCCWVGWGPWGRWQRWLRAAWAFVQGKPATQGLFASSKLRRQLRTWLQQYRPNAVLVFCSSMAQYLDLPGLEKVRTVVDLVDVDSQKWFDYARLSWGWRRWAYKREGQRLRQLEHWIGQRADAVLLTGPHEAALYRQIAPEANLHVIINGVDTEYFRPDFGAGAVPEAEKLQPAGADSAAGPQARCVFVGALDYQANIDAITWFCQEVWPLVRQRRPDAEFLVVGSNPTRAVYRLASRTPGFRLIGPVPDVRPYLAKAEVVVIPLRVARGIQNKVLEAMAMGKAVLASPQALEGLAIQPAHEAESAEDPISWAEKLVALWADPNRRASLGQTGRRYVETHHQWPQVLQPLAHLLGLPSSEVASPNCALGRVVLSGKGV